GAHISGYFAVAAGFFMTVAALVLLLTLGRRAIDRARNHFLNTLRRRDNEMSDRITAHMYSNSRTTDELGSFSLFLRSFTTDHKLDVDGNYLEALLALSILRDARLVSITDEVQNLGAIGIRVAENEWQDWIKNLARRAERIIVIPDSTAGVLWELC